METQKKLILPSSINLKANGLIALKPHSTELIATDEYKALQKFEFDYSVLNKSGGKAYQTQGKMFIGLFSVFILGICIFLYFAGFIANQGLSFCVFMWVIFFVFSMVFMRIRGQWDNEISKQEYEDIRTICGYHKPTLEYVSLKIKKNGLLTHKDLAFLRYYVLCNLTMKVKTIEEQIIERKKTITISDFG